jgi:uracil-DNA glycosylase
VTDSGEDRLQELRAAIAACRVCRDDPVRGRDHRLPHEPRPVAVLSASARILIAGQAPGLRVHESGLPFNDASGDRLRQWLAVDRAAFYDPQNFAIVPMGFCFPGYDSHGSVHLSGAAA